MKKRIKDDLKQACISWFFLSIFFIDFNRIQVRVLFTKKAVFLLNYLINYFKVQISLILIDLSSPQRRQQNHLI